MGAVNSNQGEGRGGKKRTAGIAILILIILALAGVIAFLLLRKPEGKEQRNVVITPDNVDEVIQQMGEDEFVEPGHYAVTMSYDWHFATGDAVSPDAWVENVTRNTNPVYVDIFLASDEESPIYKSPVIPVGSGLEDIALDTPLDAGIYDCVAVYHLVDEDQNTLSTLRITLTITVEG